MPNVVGGKKMEKEYNVGLDIGTNSVGWAVVNANTNEVIKKGKKALWGVRLFEEAKNAGERRVQRGTRRRFDRRRKRIKLLQQLFQDEIRTIDPNFFTKMKEAFYREEDYQNKTIPITIEEKDKIKKYYQEYPTIYHVRKKLIESEEKQDIRLVYLGLHHIIKYRGNFLNAGEKLSIQNLDIKSKWKEIFESIATTCQELEIDEQIVEEINYEQLEKAVLEDSNTDKKKYIEQELKPLFIKKEFISELGKAMTGNKFTISNLFMIELEDEIKISFKGSEYEDNYDQLEKALNEKIETLELMKELYSMIFLKKLFKGESTSISTLMVKRYEEHKQDLEFLKKILRYNRKEYNKIFRTHENKYICKYDQYIHNAIDYDEFKKDLKKSLANTFEYVKEQALLDQYVGLYKEKLEKGNLLPRITEKDNGKFPYQLNLEELEKIIQKQGKYYPFLLEIGENGKNKIHSLLEFRIPYYIGPLNDTTNKAEVKNPNTWIIRKNNKSITPYNFEQVVDIESSAEQFILRMISHCTYILNEPAIPAHSILYSEFKVRNELKQIKVNDYKLPIEIQEKMYQDIFLKLDKCPTNEVITKYLQTLPDYKMYQDNLNITGYSAPEKFANSMKSYVDFFGENGIFKNTSYTVADAETIIRWITIFEDKKIVENKLKREYSELSEACIKTILSKKYTGWSNLSEKLLTTKYYLDEETQQSLSILDLLKTTEQNFMQIINNDKYDFQKMIDACNQVNAKEPISYQLVKDLTTSPAIKRGIYQTLLVLEETIKTMGYEPKRVVIEMAREEEKKVRKDSKKDYLNKIYLACKKDIENYDKLKKELDYYENESFNKQKLFLYFIQEGKSLYSGETLNIEELDKYEIDHIIPRTLIKDDSIDNKALVLRKENQEKAANVVLMPKYRTEDRIKWWNHLKDIGLLSNKKFYNLCRKDYSQEDIDGFVNRQLVETRKITKHVANIIKNYHKESDVVYLKASLSHAYREKFELFKFRELNDYHHAHDAYLAAVLGEFKQTYLKKFDFTTLKEWTNTLLEKGLYKEIKYGYVINSLDNRVITLIDRNTGEILFDADSFNKTIANTLYRNDIIISYRTEIKTGEFYQKTKNKKGKSGTPLKANWPTKWYGSYTKFRPSYVVVVQYEKKGKEKQKMIGIPVLVEEQSKVQPNRKLEYIRSVLNLKETSKIKIVMDKIPFDTLLDWNRQICRLKSAAANFVEVCNAKEFQLNKEHMQNWKYTLNRLLNNKGKDKVSDSIYERQLEEIISYIVEKIKTEYKLYENLISEISEGLKINHMDELSLEEKEKIIKEMLKLLKCNSVTANLSFLKIKGKNMSSAFGRKNNKTIEHAKVYHQSVTGLKEYYYEF